jgi:hypothetical protein
MSEAQRLADKLNSLCVAEFAWPHLNNAATELRRLAPMEAELQQARYLCDRLKLEAQCHEQEARTANATIAEIYQAVSGGSGEPGNWHGARPVIEALQQAREERTALLVNEQNLREELAAAKSVPMKYRRMEFNAQLQDENNRLREELAALRASLSKPVGFASDLDRPSPRFVTDLKFCTISEHEAGDHLKYIPLFAIKDTK